MRSSVLARLARLGGRPLGVVRLVAFSWWSARTESTFLALTLILIAFTIMRPPSASAETPSPWWHLSVSARPTYLQPGQARSEVQRVTVGASVTSYELEDTGAGLFERTGVTRKVKLERLEKPEQIQIALEKELYGPGTVKVSEVPGALGQQVLEVEFTGKLADLPVRQMAVVSGEVQVAELTKGRPDGEVDVTVVNLGDANTSQPVTVKDILPAGLQALAVEGSVDEDGYNFEFGQLTAPLECSLPAANEAVCPFTGEPPSNLELLNPLYSKESFPKFVPPFELIRMRVAVTATGATSGATNIASVTGGGASAASVRRPITVSSSPPPFGTSTYELRPENEGGSSDTQAGSHPFQLTTSFNLNETLDLRDIYSASPLGLAKDLHFRLPPGLIGNPAAIPRCPLSRFLANLELSQCPADTVVGAAVITVNIFNGGHNLTTLTQPVYNLEPERGEPARFGFVANREDPVLLDAAVRTGGDYGVTVSVANVTEQIEFLSNEVIFWGVPGY